MARRTRITFEPIDLSAIENHYLLAWLDAQCFPDDTPAIIPGAEWWIGRNPIGVSACYCAYRVRYESRTPVAELYRAGVMPGFRGQGLQRRMIDLRCKAAKKQNLKTAMTVTAWNNAASMRSLMAAGFKPHRPNAYTTILETLVHWRKEL